MVCTPEGWRLNPSGSNAIGGGYLHNKYNLINLVRTKMVFNSCDMALNSKSLNIINKLQETRYSLSCIQVTHDRHTATLEVNLRVHAMMPKGNDPAFSEKINLNHRRLYYVYESANIRPLQYLCKAYSDILEVCNSNNFKFVYLTVSMCFRGRCYINGLVSPTSDKVLRANIRPYNSESEVITLDASASVLQVLSVITRSVKLAKRINLIGDGTPIDAWMSIYNELLHNTKTELGDILD